MPTTLLTLIRKGFTVTISMGDDGYIYIEATHPNRETIRAANRHLDQALQIIRSSQVYKELS